jgi:hypothetical protein
MTARSNVQSMLGAKFYLSVSRPVSFDAAGYADTDLVWVEVGEVENFGNHGGSASISTFTPVATGIVAKLKGSKDYGTMSMVCGNVPGDAGQIIVDAAFESTNRYSAKIVYPLGDGESTPETHYLDVLVAKNEEQDGSVNDVRKVAFDIAICKAPIRVSAT